MRKRGRYRRGGFGGRRRGYRYGRRRRRYSGQRIGFRR